MIKRIFQIAMLCVLTPLLAAAQQWDEAQYRQIEQSIRTPHFADKAYVITQYGAKTTNTAAKNQKAIQKAIDLCSKKGGGRVVIPANQKFLTGAIQLKSGVNLEVQEGAVLEFAFQPELYPIVETSWEGLAVRVRLMVAAATTPGGLGMAIPVLVGKRAPSVSVAAHVRACLRMVRTVYLCIMRKVSVAPSACLQLRMVCAHSW